jgi:AP-3 complex subunit delta-1
MSLLTDLLPRISHSNAVVRKKAVVALYRLALVYPEALRLAWPKIKERLMDRDEDSNVTAAVVNVVCELGWRRPHDFLPLAPRFFELLVDGGNNWMAIKIIKLVSTLPCILITKKILMLSPLVRYPDAARTSINSETPSPFDKYYPNHYCYVPALRVYQRYHPGRSS